MSRHDAENYEKKKDFKGNPALICRAVATLKIEAQMN
jgi:hypothetical protein